MTSFALAGDVAVRVTGVAAKRLVREWIAEEKRVSGPLDLVVRDAPSPIVRPKRPRDAFFGEIDVWTIDDAHFLIAAAARARVRGDVVEAEGTADPPPWLGLLALALALRSRAVFHIHAGGVLLDEGAVLVVGGSGAGKTTTTLALLAAVPGARALGDDALFLRSNGDLLATTRPYHVTDTTLAMFPLLAAQATGAVHEATRKHVVPAASATRLHRGALRACVFPQVVADPRSTAARLSGAETLALLVAQSAVLALPGVAARGEHLALLARIADRTPGIALRLGADARHDPACGSRAALEAIARCY